MYELPTETGLIPKPHDPRTFNHAQHFGADRKYLDSLPKMGLGRKPISIENQLFTNFCTAFATSTAAEYIEGVDMSPEFQVAKISELLGYAIVNGAPALGAMKAACLFGSLPKKDAPPDMTLTAYDPVVIADPANWPRELNDIASKHKMGSYFDILRGPFDYFDNIKVALAQAKDSGEERVGMAFTQFWKSQDGDGIVRRGKQGFTWHAHLFIDWTIRNGEEVLVEQNSYGPGWGIDGLSYWSREAVNQLAEDNRNEVFMFRDVSAKEVKNQQWTIGIIIYDMLARISPAKALEWLTKFFTVMDETPLPAPAPTPAPAPVPPKESRREKIYKEALAMIGKDASPKDTVNDDVACVESLCAVVRKVVPMPDLYNTKDLLDYLNKSKAWRGTADPKPGNIIVSATGTGNGNLAHGHTGIHAGNGEIMSNTSKDGIWRKNLTVEKWVKYYRQHGGMRLYYFEAVD